ncbi:hypothetical protein GH733_017852 [Mirounga leonina]|nr:hypothetical protein GH733_017852 [Mirounga leonina]
MDFSRLHMYTPPQCVPENTGYTYALSSSYSSDALAFETEHRLDPVFDSPRMSRRSLRLVTTTCAVEDGQAGDAHSCPSSTVSLKDRAARTVKQRRSASKSALSINHTSRKVVSCAGGQSVASTRSGAACLRPPVLDESLIREQTKVDHFWGLDDDGDFKGGNKAATQGNGDLAAEATRSNGYTCSDCLLLSERKDALTAHSAPRGPSPRLYSRDASQKPESVSLKGHLLVQTLQRIGASGWSVSKTLLSVLWCLRNICKFLILLIPLLLLLGAGLSLCGQGDFLSGLPVLSWTHMYGAQRVDGPESSVTPDASHLSQPPEAGDGASHWHRMSEVERQMTSLSGQCRRHDEKLRELAAVLQKLQAQVDQMDGDREGTLSLIQRVVGQHLQEMGADRLSGSQTDAMTFHQEHELRLSNLEDVLGKLTEKSEVDAQVRETIKLMFSDGEQGGSLEWLLQMVSSRFVSKDDLQVLLRDLELQILKNITHYISVTKQVPDSETVVSAAKQAGISGITEAQARVIVNNALKLYSQDKTGMVDFALESGGGSILSTRCSETYETKTALISLFGIPLWYFSQSPRVVIQGLENEYQEEGQLLGQFMYDQEGESLQMFHILKKPDGTFQIVELRILSNWGHPEYTCLYRFRVHGEPVK